MSDISVTKTIEAAISAMAQAATAPAGNLTQEVDRFRLIRENTLAALSNVSRAQSEWSPKSGQWSIVQIADHLLLTEEMYRDQFRELIRLAREGGSVHQLSLKEVDSSMLGIPRGVMQLFEVPARLVSSFLPQPVREVIIRHPILSSMNPSASSPRADAEIGKLRTALAQSLVETEALLCGPLPSDLEKPIVDHPLIGRTNLRELFRVVIVHEERHQDQIASLKSRADFPRR